MDTYLTTLLESELPFGPWAFALTWVLLFAANHWIAGRARVANDAQTFIEVEDWAALRRGFSPLYAAARVLYAACVFAISLGLGNAAFAFLFGGLVVATANALALNAQGLLNARVMARADAATGRLRFSTASAIRHNANRVTGAAIACLVIGLVLAQLALLGGAFFLAAMAIGHLRRANRTRAQT